LFFGFWGCWLFVGWVFKVLDGWFGLGGVAGGGGGGGGV